jgi:hypothetical protein
MQARALTISLSPLSTNRLLRGTVIIDDEKPQWWTAERNGQNSLRVTVPPVARTSASLTSATDHAIQRFLARIAAGEITSPHRCVIRI